jgi:hypothetical protein
MSITLNPVTQVAEVARKRALIQLTGVSPAEDIGSESRAVPRRIAEANVSTTIRGGLTRLRPFGRGGAGIMDASERMFMGQEGVCQSPPAGSTARCARHARFNAGTQIEKRFRVSRGE